MKLLLDQNLSHRLIKLLSEAYPNSSQVSLIQMDRATDLEIWEFAKDNNFAIVTMDADFHEYSLLKAGPPLVIWLRCGNQGKQTILEKLLKNRHLLESAERDDEVWCVEIY